MYLLMVFLAFAGIAVTLVALPIVLVQLADHRSEEEELAYRENALREPVSARYPDTVDLRSTDDSYLDFVDAHRSAA